MRHSQVSSTVRHLPNGQLCQIDGSCEKERNGSPISKGPVKEAKDSPFWISVERLFFAGPALTIDVEGKHLSATVQTFLFYSRVIHLS